MRPSAGSNAIVSSAIVQLTPSALRPTWRFISRVVSSTRKTPAYPSRNGTTAELKMLFERGS